MVAGGCFEGDNNELLLEVQENLYELHTARLFRTCRSIYSTTARQWGCGTGFLHRLESVTEFDKKLLRRPYEIIAAYYRYKYCLKGSIADSVYLSDIYHMEMEQRWRQYFREEAYLLSLHYYTNISVLIAVMSASHARGKSFETLLSKMLYLHYGKEFLELCSGSDVYDAQRDGAFDQIAEEFGDCFNMQWDEYEAWCQ